MSVPTKSGIQTTTEGALIIPASRRADGSTRKEIRVRPGYRPPEDVETYKNRNAEAWKTRDGGAVPGAEPTPKPKEPDARSKNAKRREAARNKALSDSQAELTSGMQKAAITDEQELKGKSRRSEQLVENETDEVAAEADRQKKIRNALKKLKAVHDLKDKKAAGEKLSHDQVMKIGKEAELLRDLQKLDYEVPEDNDEEVANQNGG